MGRGRGQRVGERVRMGGEGGRKREGGGKMRKDL